MIRLSEMMLLGSVVSGQAFGVFEDRDGNTCAIGSALKAAGRNAIDISITKSKEVFPILNHDALCPVDGCRWGNNKPWYPYMPGLFLIVTHLNEEHQWTRQEIAAFVATIEPQEPTETACEPARQTSNIGA